MARAEGLEVQVRDHRDEPPMPPPDRYETDASVEPDGLRVLLTDRDTEAGLTADALGFSATDGAWF